MKYIVDRIENGFAVCEKDDLSIINIPLSQFDEEVHEGSVIAIENGRYVLDRLDEEQRRRSILELQDSLFSDDE